MAHKEIKELLLMMFKNEFNINKKVGITDSTTDSFTHDINFEFKTDKWHDVAFNVCGTIQKNISEIYYHNPEPEFGGPGEAQGGEIYIDSWEFNEIEVYIDGLLIKSLITFEDLYTLIETKNTQNENNTSC